MPRGGLEGNWAGNRGIKDGLAQGCVVLPKVIIISRLFRPKVSGRGGA